MFHLCSHKAVPNRSTPSITRLALRVLEDAAAEAAAGTVERTWGHRLALEQLRGNGLIEPWQANAFWKALAGPITDPDRAENDHFYIASVTLTGLLDTFHYRLGLRGIGGCRGLVHGGIGRRVGRVSFGCCLRVLVG